jgi:hypothetical protein
MSLNQRPPRAADPAPHGPDGMRSVPHETASAERPSRCPPAQHSRCAALFALLCPGWPALAGGYLAVASRRAELAVRGGPAARRGDP